MKRLMLLLAFLFLAIIAGTAQASLEVIGTASYDSNGDGTAEMYNLIWEDNNNGKSLIWLDYSNYVFWYTWYIQGTWVKNLGSNLTNVKLLPSYSVNVTLTGANAGWRLPETVDGDYTWGYDGTTTGGYNITSSELGYLYYEELGNKGYYATDGTNPQPGFGLNNTSHFINLQSNYYWSGTEYSSDTDRAWGFGFGTGDQYDFGKFNFFYGLAVLPGEVSRVPIPGAVWLLGSGLIGLAATRRKENLR